MQNKIDRQYAGCRLDVVLSKMYPMYSRTKLCKLLKSGSILINNQTQKPRFLVKGSEQITLLKTTDESTLPWQAQAIDLDIIYQDQDIIIINKPAGLVVHPGAGNWDGTLVNGLLNYDPSLKNIPRAGIVHRLDKDTSGLLVVARTLIAHTSLIRQLQARTIKRQYLCIVRGTPITGATINAFIGRHKTKRTQMAVVNNGKQAITHYRIVKKFREHTLLKVILETGRTHQIRVHMAYKKMPIIGDKVYGGRIRIPTNCSQSLKTLLQQFPRQALHAKKLGFIHPKTNKLLEFDCKLPSDIEQLKQALEE